MPRALLAIATVAFALAGCGDDALRASSARARHRAGRRAPLRRRADRERPQPPDLGRRGARRPRARSGCSSSPAAWSGSTAGGARRCSTSPTRSLIGAEQGLLGIAFHPDFATNRRLYLHWSRPRGDTRVAEFRARATARSTPRPRRELLFVDQPEENHNGGQLAFGPDGRLYLGLGDGGGAFDPRATRPGPATNLLGKLDRHATSTAPRPRLGRRADRPAQPVALLRSTPRSARSGSATSARTRSRRSTACCSSSTSRRRTSAGARTRARAAIEGHDARPRAGELVWPVADYTHDEGGCSVTGGLVYARRRAARARPPLRLRRLLLRHAVVAARHARAAAPSDVRRERGESSRS